MNMPATDIKDETIVVEREFMAPAERVFRAWTDPDVLGRWFGPEGVICQSAHVDLKVGGEYRLALKPPDEAVTVVHGTYREIDPPRRLVFTWILDDQKCEGSEGLHAETLVTIDFQELGNVTRLTLSHDFLPTKESRDGHLEGWIGCLDSLAAAI